MSEWHGRPVREESSMVPVDCGPCAASGEGDPLVGWLEVCEGAAAYFHPADGDHYRSAIAGVRVRCAEQHRLGLPGERLAARLNQRRTSGRLRLPEAGPPRGEAARKWLRRADRRRRIRKRLHID